MLRGVVLAMLVGGAPVACAPQRFEYAAIVMGVDARVILYAHNEEKARSAATAAFDRMRHLDAVLSDWRDDSELAGLVRSAGRGSYAVSDDLWNVLAFGQEVARASDGAFDMTAAPAVALWREARRDGRLPDAGSLEAARHRTGWRRVTLDAPLRRVSLEAQTALDLGAIGKGYAADEALAVLALRGVHRALVDLGGDLAVGEAPPRRRGWRVAIATGEGAGQSGWIEVVRAGVAHSSDAVQSLEVDGVRYSHIIDPRTGQALIRRRAVTVTAPDAMTADALASALSVLSLDEGIALLRLYPGSSFIHE